MKSLMIAAACGAMALAGTAQAADPAPATIVVTGRGVVEAAPDSFSLTAEVSGRGADQAEAVRQLAQSQTAVTDALSRLEGLTSGRINTGLPAVAPVYDGTCQRHDADGCLPIAYVATLELSLQGMPADKGGDAVSLAAERGARNARLTRLYIADESDERRQAAQAAYADARRQAETIAAASGQRVIRLSRVTQPDGRQNVYGLTGNGEIDANYGDVNGYWAPETSLSLTPDVVRISTTLEVAFEIE